MAFRYLSQQQEKNSKKEIQVRNSDLDLNTNELELIIRLLGQTHFPVKDIEILYIALYKLQEQHKQLSSEIK